VKSPGVEPDLKIVMTLDFGESAWIFGAFMGEVPKRFFLGKIKGLEDWELVSIGVDDGALVDVGGLEGRHRHDLQAGAGGQNVPQLSSSELDDRNFSGNWNLMSHSDEIRNPILGRLKVRILIIIVIVIVIVYNFAAGEQVVSC